MGSQESSVSNFGLLMVAIGTALTAAATHLLQGSSEEEEYNYAQLLMRTQLQLLWQQSLQHQGGEPGWGFLTHDEDLASLLTEANRFAMGGQEPHKQ